jgi:hypothetical protein
MVIFGSLVLIFPALGEMCQSHIFKVFDQFIFSIMMQRVAYFYLESGFKPTGTERHLFEIAYVYVRLFSLLLWNILILLEKYELAIELRCELEVTVQRYVSKLDSSGIF